MDKIIFRKLNITKETIEEQDMNIGEFLYVFLYVLGYTTENIENEMLKKGSAKFEMGKIVPTLFTMEKVRRMVASQNAPDMTDEELMDLAKRMKAIFPKGIMMDGIPWTEGPILIVQRLKGFINRFGNYPKEDIIKATERYVGIKRNSPYMRSLKNFIYKETDDDDLQSDLYNFLENPDTLLNPLEDWTVELRE